jgi:hypothetical protein
LTFYDKLPEQRNGGFVLLIPRYSKGNVIIRNSKFHSNRARGLLLLMGDVTVENCHIYDIEMVGMRLETGYAICWAEGTFTNNVVVRNCTVKGEYLAWYAEDLTFENCTIIGTQPLCYCKGLKLVNCKMVDCDLAFERSEVEADIHSHVVSIKNVTSGLVTVDSVGEVIVDEPFAQGTVIVRL